MPYAVLKYTIVAIIVTIKYMFKINSEGVVCVSRTSTNRAGGCMMQCGEKCVAVMFTVCFWLGCDESDYKLCML